jgi:[acyl-carrier-protein] S-malonyltransferase
MSRAFVFPGQGSQQVGMGRALADSFPAARRAFEIADEVLGVRLSTLCFEGPEEELKLTANLQPAILATSIAALRVLEEKGVRPDYVAGHSLGEYSALVAARALSFEDALVIVRKRGQYMQGAVPDGEGAMAALLGCDVETANSVCAEASSLGVCAPANLNSPSQTVIAGHRSAVQRAVELAKERGAKRAVLLAVSAPFHCSLMSPAAKRLEPLLRDIEFQDLTIPLVTNVDAEIITSGDLAREALIRQVASPVNWWQSMRRLVEEGVDVFVEVGHGKVLSGLVKQIERSATALSTEDVSAIEATTAALAETASIEGR